MQNTINLPRTQWIQIKSEEALFLSFGVFIFMRFIWNIRATYALSFYRSQNGLCISKFVLDQKFIYILCQTKRWFAFSKTGAHIGTKVFEEALIKCSQIFGLTQNIWTGTKHVATCKRTRHYYFIKIGARSYENA